MLAALKMDKWFDTVILGEECPMPKPHPDPYLAALDYFGIKKDEALICEDSPSGESVSMSPSFNADQSVLYETTVDWLFLWHLFSQSHKFLVYTLHVSALKPCMQVRCSLCFEELKKPLKVLSCNGALLCSVKAETDCGIMKEWHHKRMLVSPPHRCHQWVSISVRQTH